MRICSPRSALSLLGMMCAACFADRPGGAATGGDGTGVMSSSGGATGATTSGGSSSGTGAATALGGTGETDPTGTSSAGTTEPGTTGADPDSALTLLSLNLHCFKLEGTVFASNAERFAAIASLAAAQDVAVLTVQEACARPGEQAIDALEAALEAATGASWSSTWALAHVAWEGTPDEADEGVGLLVRGALAEPAALEHTTQGSLRRIAASATLPPELGGVRVTSVHFELFEPGARAAQAREAAAAALVDTEGSFSAIVAGDFNDVEGSAAHAAFLAMGFLAADAGLDPAGIDHVMLHRAADLRPAAVEEVFLGREAVSDHPGVLVRFAPARGDDVTTTRVTAHYDPGADHFLSVRGDMSPLSWTGGFAMRPTGPGEHVFVTTELAAAFAFKVLLDDVTWQTGPNVAGDPGTENVVDPAF